MATDAAKINPFLQTWSSYSNDLLNTKQINHVLIFDVQESKVLTINSSFTITQEEIEKILEQFNDVYNKSIKVAGTRYTIRAADRTSGILAKNGDGRGCTVCKTNSLLIVTTHEPKKESTVSNEATMALGDFFRNNAL